MARYSGVISSLGDYVNISTTVVREDAQGRQRVGFFDRQQERFIDGLRIGQHRFGRVSCPQNIYDHLQTGKESRLYTWLHPFLGSKPIRVGIVGVAYPAEGAVYMMSFTQLLLSLLVLALLPILWVIPAFIVGGVLQWALNLGKGASAFIIIVVALAPWLAGLNLAWNYWRMKAKFR
jgi:hypothetical protein